MNKKIIFLLILLFFVAYYLRVMYLKEGALLFIYDQARDAIESQKIISGDLKIQGPPSSTPGLNHGVFWYYFLVIPNLISSGKPIISAYWNAIFSTGTLFIVYIISTLFMKKDLKSDTWKVGLLSTILFVFSFESSQYATWISNPSTAIWSVPAMYLGLWIWITNAYESGFKNYIGPLITGLFLGLSVQANIFLLYNIVPVVLWLLLSNAKDVKKISVFASSFFVAISTFVVSEIKFGFKGLKGFENLITGGDSIISNKRFGDLILLFLNQIGDVYSNNSLPISIFFGSILVISCMVWVFAQWFKANDRKTVSWEPFLLTWLLVTITVVSIGGASTPFLAVGVGPAVSILLGICIYKIFLSNSKFVAVLIFLLVVMSNLYSIVSTNKDGQTLFAIQKDMLIKNQYALVDNIYVDAEGEDFTINSLTVPLWINIVWAYHFDNYGYQKYGYLPYWTGVDQSLQLTHLPDADVVNAKHYSIIEPLGGMPVKYFNDFVYEENNSTDLFKVENWGELRLQYRVKLDDEK